jgi:subtilisin family serine protease/flagellar hook assembly protein FlgD
MVSRENNVKSYARFILLLFFFFCLGISGYAGASEGYVPGEIIVKLKNQGSSAFSVDASGIRSLLPEIKSDDIVEIKGITSLKTTNGFSAQSSAASQLYSVTVADNVDEEALVRSLNSNSNVAYAQLNHYVQLCLSPNDTYFNSSGNWGQSYDDMWAIKNIKADKAWDFTTGDSDVVVAVIDTGVDYNHPEIRGRVIKGYDFSDYDDDPMDFDGHGTHVAGIIAAAGNNSVGIAGVSWNSKILAIKIFPFGTEADCALAIIYAADWNNYGVDVINMSWKINGVDVSPILSDAIEYAANKGIVMIAAAGNDGGAVANCVPANHRDVIAVGAVDQNDKIAPFSNTGKEIDVVAPGGGGGTVDSTYNILSLKSSSLSDDYNQFVVGNDYLRLGGTSMAAPYVSGLAALILSKNHTLSKGEVESKIKFTADNLGDSDVYGQGRINAYEALLSTLPSTGNNEENVNITQEDVFLSPPKWVKKLTIGDIAFDSNNNMYVVYTNQSKIVKYTLNSSGMKVSTAVMSINSYGNDPLYYPMGIAVSPSGDRVYVADTFRQRILAYDEKLNPITKLTREDVYKMEKTHKYYYYWPIVRVREVRGESSEVDNAGVGDHFFLPTSINVSSGGGVYVVDKDGHRLFRYNRDLDGEIFSNVVTDVSNEQKLEDWKIKHGSDAPQLVVQIIEKGFKELGNWLGGEENTFEMKYRSNEINDLIYIEREGWAQNCKHFIPGWEVGSENGRFTFPESAAVDSFGNIYVSDTGNNRIQKFTPDGSFLSKFGEDDLSSPGGIDVDSYGNVWVADSTDKRIVQFDTSGKFIKAYQSDDYEIDPQKIKVREGKIYIADANHDEPLVWNIAGEITNFNISNSNFSPNSDGLKDNLNIAYNLSQPAEMTIQLTPRSSEGVSASGVSESIIFNKQPREIGQNEESWDGFFQQSGTGAQDTNSSSQEIVADGHYSLKLTAAFGDYLKTKSANIVVDTEAPTINLNRAPPQISPNGDDVNDELIIDYSVSDNLSPSAEVKITLYKYGQPANVFIDETKSLSIESDLLWNGKILQYLVEGEYEIELKATDLAGNISTTKETVVVDATPPRIEAISLSNEFISPNADGKKDDTTISFNLSDGYSQTMFVTVQIEDEVGLLVKKIAEREVLDFGEHSFTWEAIVGEVFDGNYALKIYAEDQAGNLGTSEPIIIVVDTVAPTIESFVVIPNPFSPNNDGVKDVTTFNYQLSEASSVKINILNEDMQPFRTFNESSQSGSWNWDGSGVCGEILGLDHPYYLYAEDRAGNITTSETQTIVVQHEPSLVPYAFASPDPFAPSNPNNSFTKIKYYLTRDNLLVTVEVVGREGRLVKRLVNGEIQNKGEHLVSWIGDYDVQYDGPQNNGKVSDGLWEFRVTAISTDEQNMASTSNTILIDDAPPYILADPVDVDLINKRASVKYSLPEAVSIEVSVFDENDTFVEQIEGFVDKHPGVYSATWEPTGSVNALTYFKISAVDKALNEVEKKTEIFSIVPQQMLQIKNSIITPNPFTPNGDGLTDLTKISYSLSGGVPDYTVSINIETETGSTIKSLIENETQIPGTYSFFWDGTTDGNQLAADGNYEYQIIVEDKLGAWVEGRGTMLLVLTRPTVNFSIIPTTISPNGDGASDFLNVDYSIDYPVQYITGDALVKLEVIDASTTEAVWSRIFNHSAGGYAYQYDGLMTNGVSLPAGSYYLRIMGQDALGSTAISKMTEFVVDYTQPEPSDFSITPSHAKLGSTVVIDLEFEEALLNDPAVNILGIGSAILSVNSGNSYTYTYTVEANDPEGSFIVSVEAQDLALNVINKTKMLVIDKTNPQVSNVVIAPNPASVPGVSGQVNIQFNVDETLLVTPKVYVTQNGASPQLAIVSDQYEAKYDVVTGYDGLALITIEVTDLANNPAIYQANNLLMIDTISPTFNNVRSEISNNPDFTTYAKEGSEVIITFTSSEQLNFNPDVRVNGNLANYNGLIGDEYNYLYDVSNVDAEGNVEITITGYDFAGNKGEVQASNSEESFVIDLVNPAVSISHDPAMIANPSPFSVNASSEVGHRQTRLQYETSEYGRVTVNVYKVPNDQTVYGLNDFNGNNLIISFDEGWLISGGHYRYWDGAIDSNQIQYDTNNNGYADPGKYAFIVEVRDKAGNLVEGKWGGTCWIQDNLLMLESPDQMIEDNPFPKYFSPNGDGSFEVTEVFFRVKLGVTPAEPAAPERISVMGVLDDFKWLEGEVKLIGTYTVRVFDESKTTVVRTIVSDAPLYSNTVLSEAWDGRDDGSQIVSEGSYKIEIDARDFIGGEAENNLLTVTATIDVSLPDIISNEPNLANTPWINSAKSFDVDFFDNQNAYASKLKKAEYNLHYPSAGESGWRTIFDDSQLDSYVTNWGLEIFDMCEDGVNNISIRVIDNAGNENNQNNVFYLRKDTTPPINPSISINGGVTYTSSRNVNLSVSVDDSYSGVDQVWVRNDSEAYQLHTANPWVLRDVNGSRAVYVKFKDNAGNWTIDDIDSDTILLDRLPPTISTPTITINPFNQMYETTSINWTINDNMSNFIYYEAGIYTSGGVLVKTARVYGDGANTTGSKSFVWDGTNDYGDYVNEGDYKFKVRAKDEAGNESGWGEVIIRARDDINISDNGAVSINPYLTSAGGVLNLKWVEGWDDSLRRSVSANVTQTDHGNSSYLEEVQNPLPPPEVYYAEHYADKSDYFTVDFPQVVEVGAAAWGEASENHAIKQINGVPVWSIGSTGDNDGNAHYFTGIIPPGSYYAWVDLRDAAFYDTYGHTQIWYYDRRYNIYGKTSSSLGGVWGSTSGPDLEFSYSVGPNSCIGNLYFHQIYIGGDGNLYYQRRVLQTEALVGEVKITNTGNVSNPSIVSDSSDNAYIAWQAVVNNQINIFFQKIPYNFAPINGSVSAASIVPVISRGIKSQSTTLESPVLISPDNDTDVNSIRPTFEWQHRKGDTQEYKIDLAKNDTFAIDHQNFVKASNSGSTDKNDPTLFNYTYSIHEFDPGLDRDTYYWKVTANSSVESVTSEVRSFTVAPQLTLTKVTNYPNPFNPNSLTTKIRYRLGADVDEVNIRIYDIAGSLVKQIINCPTNGEGSSVWQKYNDVEWDGKNGRGDLVVNGIYPFEVVARLGDRTVSARGKIAVLK